MSNRRYVDISSQYRNRKSYPQVSDFVVELSTSYRNTPYLADDPIIKAFPYETNLTSGGSTFTQIALAVVSKNIVNYYRNSWLNIGSEFRYIVDYDNVTKVATVAPGFSAAPPALTLYTIRKELPIELAPTVFQDVTAGAAAATNQFVLGAVTGNASQYIGNYIFLPGGSAPGSYQWRLIINSGDRLTPPLAANIAILDRPFYAPVGAPPVPTPVAIGAGVLYEIQRFSYNNVIPLRYFGTEVGTNNPVCTTIALNGLLMPNLRVLNGYGGTLQSYPHLYLAVYSEKGGTYQYPLITNGQVSPKALFKCPVTYYNDNQFLALINSNMRQNVSFRENDDLHIIVYLPNGEILQFEPAPTDVFYNDPGYGGELFPIEPDPLRQVSLTLEVTR